MKEESELRAFTISSPCTAYELRLFADSASALLPPKKMDPEFLQFLKKTEKRVYGGDEPWWKFTPARGAVLSMLLRSAHEDAKTGDLVVFLVMCSFPDEAAKEITIDIDKMHFEMASEVEEKIRDVLKKPS